MPTHADLLRALAVEHKTTADIHRVHSRADKLKPEQRAARELWAEAEDGKVAACEAGAAALDRDQQARAAIERLPVIDDGYGAVLVRDDVFAILGHGDIPVLSCGCGACLPSRDGTRCVVCEACGRGN